MIKYIHTPEIASLRTISFGVASIPSTLRGYDVVYMLGYHAALGFVLPQLMGTNFWVVNMDRLEWQRSKWSAGTRRYLNATESFAARVTPHIVADAQGIVDYLCATYPSTEGNTQVIEYGAFSITESPDASHLEAYDLIPGEYHLAVRRLESENHVREIINGFLHSGSNHRLFITGDHEADTPYVRSLVSSAGDRVTFIGTIFDLWNLTAPRYYSLAYLYGHSVGGTKPSLLESMVRDNFAIAHDNPFNRQVTMNRGTYFSFASVLSTQIIKIEENSINANISAYLKERVTRYCVRNVSPPRTKASSSHVYSAERVVMKK